MQEAILRETRLQGVTSQRPSFFSFEEDVRDRIGIESDLTKVIFAGGLSQEDLDSFVASFSDEEAREFRERLTLHMDKRASHKPLTDAITRVYTAEEAEQWIAEYNEATKDIED